MAYVSWSVVFGEQPSAAKWNILGANDASFNDGTGIADAAITSAKLAEAFFKGRYQVNTTDNTISGYRVQMGWGQITGAGAADNQAETVTFDEAFSAAPLVITSSLGEKASSDATAIGDFVTASKGIAQTQDITTTTFVATILSRDNTNLTSGTRYGYAWIAIGAA